MNPLRFTLKKKQSIKKNKKIITDITRAIIFNGRIDNIIYLNII